MRRTKIPGTARWAAISPAQLRHYRACEAVARAVRRHGAEPECCWGYDLQTKVCRCPIHVALARLDAVTRSPAHDEKGGGHGG